MSSHFPDDPNPHDPLIGARLRYLLGSVEKCVAIALINAGFTDIHIAHFKVLRFPPPENDRPIDLAQRAGMTKQAMNYLLSQLEDMGYVQRSVTAGSTSRISLTEKGWAVAQIQRATVRAIERDWAKKMGVQRYAIFHEVLEELAGCEATESIPRVSLKVA